MKKLIFLSLMLSSTISQAQTLYVPNGTIGSTSNGNVGIGTTSSPVLKLQISGPVGDSNNGTLQIDGAGANALLRMGVNTNYSWIQGHGSSPLYINELGNNTVFNLNGGNVGIGTVPSAKLHINGNLKVQGANEIETGEGTTKEVNAGKIAYQKFSDGLDIVGAGTTGSNRKIKLWAEGGTTFTGSISAPSLLLNVKSNTNQLIFQEITEPNNEALVSMITGQQRGLLVKDRTNMTGGLWLFGGGSTSNLTNSGGVGAGFASDLGTYIPFTTATSAITFVDGRINFLANNNLTVGQPYYPSSKMRLDISPSVIFRVDGEVRAKLVRVVTDVWADYVFNKNYKLLPLENVERYINENHHLPDVPSEKEVIEKGLDLGEMQKVQMQKIEEITLYLLQMKKELDALKKENQELRTALESKK